MAGGLFLCVGIKANAATKELEMKKNKLRLLVGIFLLCGASLFSIELSAGGGFVLNVFSHAETSSNYDESRMLVGGGAYAFADATYLVATAGISRMEDSTSAEISLLLKYPVILSSSTFYPLIGGSYFVKFNDTHSNAWGIKCGFGLDYTLSEQLYLKPVILLGYRYLSYRDRVLQGLFKLYEYDLKIQKTTIDVSLALGYRF